jgi:hypothetical protein
VGLISAVTNKGELRWGDGFAVLSSGGSPSAMVLDGALRAPVLIRLLDRRIREAERKVFLILDNLPVHRPRAVQAWLAEAGRTPKADRGVPPARLQPGVEP